RRLAAGQRNRDRLARRPAHRLALERALPEPGDLVGGSRQLLPLGRAAGLREAAGNEAVGWVSERSERNPPAGFPNKQSVGYGASRLTHPTVQQPITTTCP